MTAILPQGLINATVTVQQRYPFDDSGVHITNAEVLHRFWRGGFSLTPAVPAMPNGSPVFALQSDLTEDNGATRSRNLFWRVWSSPALTDSMTSARLMRLWHQFNRDVTVPPIENRSNSPRESVAEVSSPVLRSRVRAL